MDINDMYSKCIIALDNVDGIQAIQIINSLGSRVKWYKIHALFDKSNDIIDRLRMDKKNIFLDYKLHDTPNTTKIRLQALFSHCIDLVTVHLDYQTLSIIQDVDPSSVAIVVFLTSSKEDYLTYIVDVEKTRTTQLLRHCEILLDYDINKIICPGKYVKPIKEKFGKDIITISPGIAYPNHSSQGQQLTMKAKEIINDGGDFVVIGRGLTVSENYLENLNNILKY